MRYKSSPIYTTKRLIFKRPFIKTKIASSLDSKISLSNGKSKWITGSNARKQIHLYRLRSFDFYDFSKSNSSGSNWDGGKTGEA